MGLSSHQSARMKKDEWLTPPEILRALGPFDLDPCAPADRPWPTAALHYTVRDNGLCGGEVQAKPFAVPGITGVLCDSCGAVVSFRESPDNPATCWNRRVVGGSH